MFIGGGKTILYDTIDGLQWTMSDLWSLKKKI